MLTKDFEKNLLMPMNLQLFAEPDDGDNGNLDDSASTGGQDGNDDGDNGEHEPTIEELMAELAKEKANGIKLKNSLDEASSEAAKFKKALREKQTAEEIKTEEELKAQEAHEKEFAELKEYRKRNEARERYLVLGMSAENAAKAAEAEIKGDMDELAKIQKKHTEMLLKEKEKEWIRSRPDINAGNDDGDETAKLEKQIEAIMFENNGLLKYE